MFYFSFDGSIIANEYEQSMNKTLTYCEKHTKMICKPDKYYKTYTKTKSEKEMKCRMYREKCKKQNKNVKKAGNIADIKYRKQ